MLSLTIRTTKENAKENESVLICLKKCAKKALNLKVEEIITAFLRDWLETIKPTIAETTYESYSQKLNSVVLYFDTVFSDITLAEVTAVELQKFYNDKFAEEITANTIKHYHANIHKALKYAVKIGLISCNESEKTDRPSSTIMKRHSIIPKSLKDCFLFSEEIVWR